MNWYKEINLQYMLNTKFDFTSNEINYLLQNKEKVYDSQKAFKSLLEKGFMYTYYDDDGNVKISHTEEGIKLYKAINFALTLPKVESLRDFLEVEWYLKKGNSRKKLSEKTGIHYSILTHIDQGTSSKPIKISDIRKIAEVLGMSIDDFFTNVKMVEMYKDNKLEFARKDDPYLSKEEFEFLKKIDPLSTWCYGNTKPENELLRKEIFNMLHHKEEKEDKYLKLSDYGMKFYLDIHERQTLFPKLNTVIGCIESVRKIKRISEKTLSELSGLDVELIKELEYKSKCYYRGKMHFAYIEDLEKIFECLHLDFKKEIKKLREKEIQKKLEKEKKKVVSKNTEKINSAPQSKIELKEINRSEYKILISESPIETKLLKEIINLKDTYNFEIDTQVDFSINNRNYRADIYIQLQDSNGKNQTIIVECDGHDSHEKTKEQAQKDKQRDRDFLSAGILTLRFTGSEIWRNPKKCAEEVFATFNGYQSVINN